MKECNYDINKLGIELTKKYSDYKDMARNLSNAIMYFFDGWQVYLTEHTVNVFRLNFCSEYDRRMDTSFLITKEQMEDVKCLLEEVIIPTLVQIEKKHDS